MKYLLLPLLILNISSMAEAASGSSVRGGGKGIVCRNSDGAIRSVELLDLWEARTLYGRQIQLSSLPVAEQVKYAIERFAWSEVATYDDTHFNEIVRNLMRDFMADNAAPFLNGRGTDMNRIERLRGSTLAPTDDAFEQAWPANCTVEQIVAYNGWARGSITYINQDLYDLMDPTNQAALILHEAIYTLRINSMEVKSSVRSRRAVGYLFSGGDFSAQPDQSLPHLTCKAEKEKDHIEFALFSDSPEGKLQGAVFSGYREDVIGFFPSEARTFTTPSHPINLRTILDYQLHCVTTDHFGDAFPLAIIGGAGPADFDRSGTLVGFCRDQKLETYWSESGSFRDLQALMPVKCEAINF